MHIAIVGPIATDYIKHLLNCDPKGLPAGYPGAPLLATLIDELLSRGHRVSALTTSPDCLLGENNWVSVTEGGFSIYYCGQRRGGLRPRGGYIGRALDFFSLERKTILSALRHIKPDVVHAHWAYEFGLAGLKSGFPCVVSCHDAPHVILRYMPNLYRFLRFFMGYACLRRARTVTAVSPYLKDELRRYVRGDIAVVPNPLKDSLFKYRNDERAIMAEPVMAMVLNGCDDRKNPWPALRAFASLRRKLPTAQLHLYGNTYGEGGRVQAWACEHGIADGIRFHGGTPHAELMKQLADARLLLHPALEESCPMGVAEAMALGLPVIGGEKSGGVPWVVGGGGLLVDVSCPDAIEEAMRKLLVDDELLRRLRAFAITRATELFSAARIANSYEDRYAEAIRLAEERA